MNSLSIKQLLAGIYIATFCVFATNGLGFIGWQAMFTKYQSYAVLFVPLLIILLYFNRIDWKSIPLRKLVCFLVIMPIVSCFSKNILLGESVFSVMYPVYMSLAFLAFFALWALKIEEKTIVYALVCVAVVTGFIQVYQHVTGIVLFNYFESFYNYVNDDIRNNILRLYVGSPYIQLICLLLFVDKLKQKINFIYVAFAIFLLVSIYLYLTRQFLVITLVTIIYAVFGGNWALVNKNKNNRKLSFMLLGVVGLYLLYSNWDVLFQSLVEGTKDDEGFFVRFQSIAFFFKQTFSNILGMIFGFGHSHYEERWTVNRIYASDAGIAGDMYHYGIGWAIAYFYTIRKLLFKNRQRIPFYIWLYILATFINSLFALPYHEYGTAFIWACLLYICTLHLTKENELTISM